MIELYHNDMSVCAQKVRFPLVEKNWLGKVTIRGANRISA
jgi:hypothetical protein